MHNSHIWSQRYVAWTDRFFRVLMWNGHCLGQSSEVFRSQCVVLMINEMHKLAHERGNPLSECRMWKYSVHAVVLDLTNIFGLHSGKNCWTALASADFGHCLYYILTAALESVVVMICRSSKFPIEVIPEWSIFDRTSLWYALRTAHVDMY